MSEIDITLVIKIISGGQTGVDRAALDAASHLGIPCGGWCPAGRRAEDGPIDERYPLTETDSPKYPVRTRWNIRDSDGTLILCETELLGGTLLTSEIAERMDKPLLVIPPSNSANEKLADWLAFFEINRLNVAGPRESTAPGIYRQAFDFLTQFLGFRP